MEQIKRLHTFALVNRAMILQGVPVDSIATNLLPTFASFRFIRHPREVRVGITIPQIKVADETVILRGETQAERDSYLEAIILRLRESKDTPINFAVTYNEKLAGVLENPYVRRMLSDKPDFPSFLDLLDETGHSMIRVVRQETLKSPKLIVTLFSKESDFIVRENRLTVELNINEETALAVEDFFNYILEEAI